MRLLITAGGIIRNFTELGMIITPGGSQKDSKLLMHTLHENHNHRQGNNKGKRSSNNHTPAHVTAAIMARKGGGGQPGFVMCMRSIGG